MITKTFRTSAITRTVAMIVFASGLSLTVGQVEAKKNETAGSDSERIAALVELGKLVFFTPISNPKGEQSCSSCHEPKSGWTGADSDTNLLEVAQPGADIDKDPNARGGLKPPTNAYATFIPPFNAGGFLPVGGAFWNGRAEGRDPQFPEGATEHVFLADVLTVGDPDALTVFEQAVEGFLGPVADQALNPFPNPVEQNIREKAVCHVVEATKDYAALFQYAWGQPITCDDATFHNNFKRIAVALSAYQASPEVNSFSSKRDDALRDELACLTEEEVRAPLNEGGLPWAQGLSNDDFSNIVSRFGLVFDDQANCQEDATQGQFPLAGLSLQENWGHDLFYAASVQFGPGPLPIQPGAMATCDAAGNTFPDGVELTEARLGAGCSLCHSNNAGDNGSEPLQTYADHSYHNIGTPVNFDIPGTEDMDIGLAGHTGVVNGHTGLVKTPTLRNVDKRPYSQFVKAYTRVGWFKSLESLVHFYNTSLVDSADSVFGAIPNHTVTRCENGEITEQAALESNCWPAPGHTDAISFGFGLTGNLGLSACDEAAVVAYLKTLSDTAVVELPNLGTKTKTKTK